MCRECGYTWCVRRCPNYDPWSDPEVTGACETCGEPVYDGASRCALCASADEEGETV